MHYVLLGKKRGYKKKSHIKSQSQYFGKKSQLDYFPKSFSPTSHHTKPHIPNLTSYQNTKPHIIPTHQTSHHTKPHIMPTHQNTKPHYKNVRRTHYKNIRTPHSLQERQKTSLTTRIQERQNTSLQERQKNSLQEHQNTSLQIG